VVGCDELLRFIRQNGKSNASVAFVLGLLPDAGKHEWLAVLSAEEIWLLAALFPLLVKALCRDDATPLQEVSPELPSLHPVEPRVQERGTGFAVPHSLVNAEAGHHHAVSGDQNRHCFGWRDVRIEHEVDARTAIKVAGNSETTLLST
jgi:hypothetical protein